MSQQPHPMERLFPELSLIDRSELKAMGTIRPVLMIAMTARTGSTHLCSGLSSIFTTEMPVEIFNGRDTMVWEKQHRNVQTFAEFLKQYYEERKNMIIFKTSWNDFSFFRDKVFTLFPNLKFLYLNRLDTEAQAVSLFKAIISSKWHDTPSLAAPAKMSDEELQAKFDLKRICQLILSLEQEKRQWENFFFANDLQPARINYESFKDGLGKAIQQILHHNGYPPLDTSIVKSDYKKLSDAINDAWVAAVHDYRSGKFYEQPQQP